MKDMLDDFHAANPWDGFLNDLHTALTLIE